MTDRVANPPTPRRGRVWCRRTVDTERRHAIEARLAELDRRLVDSHDGEAPTGAFYRLAKEHGELRRELERMTQDVPQDVHTVPIGRDRCFHG